MVSVFTIGFTLLSVSAQSLLALVHRDQPGTFFFATCSFFYLLVGGLVMRFGFATPTTPTTSAGLQAGLYGLFLLCTALYLVVLWTGRRGLERAILCLGGVAGVGSILLMALEHAGRVAYPSAGHPVSMGLVVLVFLNGSLCLGAATTGMILGHWYLVKPMGLTIAPLMRLARILFRAVILQLVLTLAALLWFHTTADPGQTGLLYRGYALWFWIRILVGNLFSLVIAYMIQETARLEANMSATGLLYIVMMTLMAGEMMSRFILVNAGILV